MIDRLLIKVTAKKVDSKFVMEIFIIERLVIKVIMLDKYQERLILIEWEIAII